MDNLSFVFDEAFSYIPALSFDLKTAVSAFILFGIIIFGISLLLQFFHETSRSGKENDDDDYMRSSERGFFESSRRSFFDDED
jgi:hypothetical protein